VSFPGRFIQRGVKINIAWIIGLILAGWVITAFYIAVTAALEAVEARARLTSAIQERNQQLELKEELEVKARALGIIATSSPHDEVLTPSREAYLKEFQRMQHLIRPGEKIVSYPLASESFPPLSEPLIPGEKLFSSPLEAWKALLGFSSGP